MKMFSIPEGHEKESFRCPYCGFVENTSPKVVTQLAPGNILNKRYVLGTVIGAGGFGVTYKAWDETLETVVAVKEYFPQGLVTRVDSKTVTVTSSGEASNYERGRQRFLKEARGLAKFKKNTSTVDIYDFFEENGTAYMVM